MLELKLDRYLRPVNLRTSPIDIVVGDFDGITLVFDEEYTQWLSPIELLLTGSDNGGGDNGGGDADGTPQILGINLGISWHSMSVKQQEVALRSHATRIHSVREMQWHGDVIERREHLYEHCQPITTQWVAQGWQIKQRILRRTAIRWTLPPVHQNQVTVRWNTPLSHRINVYNRWRELPLETLAPVVRWADGNKIELRQYLGWFGEAGRTEAIIQWGPHRPRHICSKRWFDFAPKGAFELLFEEPYIETNQTLNLQFDEVPEVCYWDEGGGGFIPGNPTLPPIDFKVPIQPQILRSYLMTPQISCVRLSDNLPIVLRSISIQQSRNQWAASYTITFSSKGDAERAEGETIKISINGYDFYMMVESLSASRSFGNSSYSATGRGLLAELAAPYRKAVNFVNLTERSFMGLATDIVANTGWTVATEMTDFVVPANAWSYSSKTPAEALNTMATAIGAMLNVDAENRTITFVPKWPVSPWNTSSSTPDVALHDAVILEHSERHEMRTAANAVFVRGEQVGVAVKVKRTGSAGDEFADDVLEKLITDPQAARMRGSHELAETGDKKQTQIRTKLMADLPPVTPGMLVGVTVDGSTYKATCDAWQLTAQVNAQGQVAVNQSLTLLRNAS